MNPYDPPVAETLPIRPSQRLRLRAIFSVMSLGPVIGTVFLFCVTPLFILPFWGPPIYKGDDRWETIFCLATTGLPLSMIGGVVAASVWYGVTVKHLTVGQMSFCWFLLIGLIPSFRPVVDRIRRPGNTPLYESIPDTLWYISIVVFLVTLAVFVIQQAAQKHKILDEPSDARQALDRPF